ncbi:MAG: InlB B-repeat-containing protein [Ruminococcus sp.]
MKEKVKLLLKSRKIITLSITALLLSTALVGAAFVALTGGSQSTVSQLAVKADSPVDIGTLSEQGSIVSVGQELGSLSKRLVPVSSYASSALSTAAVENDGTEQPAEAEGNCYKVTFKTHGYCAGDNGTKQTTIHTTYSLYSEREGTNKVDGNSFTVSDGGEYVYYVNKSNYNNNYYLKHNSPFSAVQSYKIYATDSPSVVYTDDTTDSYKQYISTSQWSNGTSELVTFNNKAKVDITIEVTYTKSYNKVYFERNALNNIENSDSFSCKGNFIYNNNVGSQSSVTFSNNGSIYTFCQDDQGRYYLPVKKDDCNLTFVLSRPEVIYDNFQAYKMTDSGPESTPIDGLITQTVFQTKYNDSYSYQLPESSDDILIKADAKQVKTFFKFSVNGRLFSNLSLTTTNGYTNYSSISSSAINNIIAYSGYEYTMALNSDSGPATLVKAELKYVDLNGDTQTESYTVTDNSFTFKMPYVNTPKDYSTTTLTLYSDEGKIHNLEILSQATYKGGVKISDTSGYGSITNHSQAGSNYVGESYLYKEFTASPINNSFSSYDLCAGRTYKVENSYSYYKGVRLVLENIEIFKKDSEGNVTEEKVDVTKNTDGTFTFVMPDCDIQLKTIFYDKLHRVILQNAQVSYASTTFAPTDNADGKSYMFTGDYLGSSGTTKDSLNIAADSSNTVYAYALEEGVYTLNVDIQDPTARRVKSVTAYKLYNGKTNIQIDKNNNTILNEPYEDQDKILTKNEDGTYTVNINYKAIDEGASIIIYTEFEEIEESYVNLEYNVKKNTYSGSPSTKLTLEYPVKDGKDTVLYPIGGYYGSYNEEGTANYGVRKNQSASFVLNSCYYNRYTYSGTYTAYTITVKNTDTNETVAKVYYRNEECEFLEGTAGDVLCKPVVTYDHFNADSQEAVNDVVTFNLNIKDYPLSVTIDTGLTYVPLKINQYIVNPDGTTNKVGDSAGFKTTIEPYVNQNESSYPELYQKFFAKTGSKYYTGYTNSYAQSFEVTSSSDEWECMACNWLTFGIKATMEMPENYMLANVVPVSYDRNGLKTSYLDYGRCGTVALCGFTNGSYALFTNNNNQNNINNSKMDSSEQLEVNVYYTQKSSLTVSQSIEGFVDASSNTELANVVVADAADPRENLKSFSTAEKGVADTVTYSINGKSDHTTTTDQINTWTNTCEVTYGTKPKVTVTPKGSRNIADVKAYKMVSGEKQEIDIKLVSGTGYPGSETVYQIEDAVAVNDDIYVDIAYGSAQTLKVDVRMLDSNNKAVSNTTGTNVKVTGTVLTGTEETSTQNAFLRDGETERISSFETTTTDSVYAYSNTRISVDTAIDDSGYVIANVVAYEMNDDGTEKKGNRLNLTASKVTAEGNPSLSSAAVDYSHCEMSSLPINKNTIIVVYLAKMSKMTFSVYTADDSGEYTLGNNTGDSGSYVNINSNNSYIGDNPYSIITEQDEGNFNTNAFTITNNPATRTASVIQGTRITAFAQLPYNKNYVISKLVVKYKDSEGNVIKDTNAYLETAYEYTDSTTGTKYYRVSFGSNAKIAPNRSDYTFDVYIAPAKNIVSKVTLTDANGNETNANSAGTVTVYGTNNIDTDVKSPFSVTTGNNYSAVSSQKPFTKSVKCVADTELSFRVAPSNANYYIKSVSAHLGSENGEEIKLSESVSGSAVTYTLLNSDDSAFVMPRLSDVYINVQFGLKLKGKLNIDYTYTDDYTTNKALTSDLARVSITGSNSTAALKDIAILTDAADESKAGNSFTLESGTETASYNVLATSSVFIHAEYVSGKYFVPYIVSVTDAEGNDLSKSMSFNAYYTSISLNNILADKEYNVKVVLAPAYMVSISQFENNMYDNSPDGVRITSETPLEEAALIAENEHIEKPIVAAKGSNSKLSEFKAKPNSDTYLVAKDSKVTVKFNNSIARPGYLKTYQVSCNDIITDNQTVYSEKPSGDDYKIFTYNDSDFEEHNIYNFSAFYDCVDIKLRTNYSHYTFLLVSSDNSIDDIITNMTKDGTLNVNNLTEGDECIKIIPPYGIKSETKLLERVPKKFSQRQKPVYLILVKNTSDEKVALTAASWSNQRDESANIRTELTQDIRNVDLDGITNYIYHCQVRPLSEQPLDNTTEFYITFAEQTVVDPPKPPETPVEAQVNITQFLRSNDSGYTETTQGKTVATLANAESKFTYNGEQTDSFSVPVDAGSGVLKPSDTAVSKTGETVNLTITPPDKCIVSKVTVSYGDGYSNNYKPSFDGTEYKTSVPLNSASTSISVYFSRPLISISTNNTAANGLATVCVDEEEVIGQNDFMDSILVDAGTSKALVVNPKTYETVVDGTTVTKYYSVAYVLMGSERNKMSMIDPSLISTDADTGVSTISLPDISDDVYLHIQLEGDNVEKTATLVVSQYIKQGEEYQISNIGRVVTSGVLEGNETPIYMDNEKLSQFTLSDQGSLTSIVANGTKLSFAVSPPLYSEELQIPYDIDVKGRFVKSDETSGSGEQLSFTKDGNAYSLDQTMPDAGIMYVDIYYSIEKYRVTYDGNGNTSGEVPTDENEYFKNNVATVLGKNTLEKEGYRFLGWSENNAADTAEYTEGSSLTVNSNVTLYAVWEELPTAKLTYKYKDRFNEEKQYVVSYTLSEQEVDNGGIPSDDNIKKYAPYIDDLLKDCTWNLTAADKLTKNQYSAELTAVQENKKYKAYIDNGSGAFTTESYEFNTLIALEAAEKDSSGKDFIYWAQYDLDPSTGEVVTDSETILSYNHKIKVRVTFDRKYVAVYGDKPTDPFTTNIQAPVFTREQSTNDDGTVKYDYVYSDFLVQFETSISEHTFKDVVNSGADGISGVKNVEFGLLTECNTAYTYNGDGDPTAPSSSKGFAEANLSSLYADNATKGWSNETDESKTEYNYYYNIIKLNDYKDSLTVFGRIDYAFKFTNNEANRGKVFNVYSYVKYDDNSGTHYVLSSPRVLNIYAAGTAEADAS